MRSYIFGFETKEDASAARTFLTGLDIAHHTLAEGFEFKVLERQNPHWDFSESVVRLLRFNMQSFRLRRMEVQYDD